MHFALGFLLYRLLDTVRAFVAHWYFDGFLFTLHHIIEMITRLDRVFAVHITIRHLFEPLYQDYSFIGRVLGFVFRSMRSVLGIMLYSVLIIVALALFMVWASIPMFLLFGIAFVPHL